MEKRIPKEYEVWWRQRTVYVPDVTLAGGTVEGLGALRAQLPQLQGLGIGALWLEGIEPSPDVLEAMTALLCRAGELDFKVILALSSFKSLSKTDGGEALLPEMEGWLREGVGGFDLGDLSKMPLSRKTLHTMGKRLRKALPEDVLLCASLSKGGPRRAAAFVMAENRELHLIRPLLWPLHAKQLFSWLARWQKGLSWPLIQLIFPNTEDNDPQGKRALLTLALTVKGMPVLRESVFPLAADAQLGDYAKELLAFRAGSEAMRYGGYRTLENTSRICRFVRRFRRDAVGVAVNLSPRRVPSPLLGQVLLGNSGRTAADLELAPFEALILKWHTEPMQRK